MAIEVKTKKWGNSLGIIIPSKEAENLKLKENQTIRVDIHVTTENPLKEMFGALKFKTPTEKILKEIRKNESKWI
ncbi:MAG: hypothetical protein AABX54_01090 [Nanoarchaeota archaeon]